MTRRSRRASSAPQRVGSDEGLTSRRPRTATADESSDVDPSGTSKDAGAPGTEAGNAAQPEGDAEAGTRHTRPAVDQSKDDTDEGWGERGDDDASARWLRENRPPHWD